MYGMWNSVHGIFHRFEGMTMTGFTLIIAIPHLLFRSVTLHCWRSLTSYHWPFRIRGHGKFRSFGVPVNLQRDVVNGSNSSCLIVLISENKNSEVFRKNQERRGKNCSPVRVNFEPDEIRSIWVFQVTFAILLAFSSSASSNFI